MLNLNKIIFFFVYVLSTMSSLNKQLSPKLSPMVRPGMFSDQNKLIKMKKKENSLTQRIADHTTTPS